MNDTKLDPDDATTAWLKTFVEADGGVSGTVHKRKGDLLVLTAAFRIPPPVIAAITTIPKGKGMAGLAWERSLPVSTCNLQTDTTGDVRPGAKAVGAKAAVALPVGIEKEGPAFVVGIAYMVEKDLNEEKLSQLSKQAESIATLFE